MAAVMSKVQSGPHGLAARFRQRFGSPAADQQLAPLPAGDRLGFNARIAELLLVNRLRARSHQRTHAAEIMERASHIVFVTCKNWFSAGDDRTPQRRKPL